MYWNDDDHNSKPLADPSTALSNATVELKDGFLYCTVVMAAVTQIATPTTPEKSVNFDLNSNLYFLLLARGPLDSQVRGCQIFLGI
jgi:hypothetical protein